MAYQHDAFPFPMEHPPPGTMYLQHPMQFPDFVPQHPHHHHHHHQHQPQPLPLPPDVLYQPFAFPEYSDFMHPGMLMDDFDDTAEVSTRPRLTKEQVEILESQFQAHAKPNSMVKKQLALQTKLTLPRVANWFQNRRAKAKQMKKQEEYEIQQSLELQTEWKSDSNSGDATEGTPDTAGPGLLSSPIPRSSHMAAAMQMSTSEAQSPADSHAAHEPSWLSMQRALAAAKAARRDRLEESPAPSWMLPPRGTSGTTTLTTLTHPVTPTQSTHTPTAQPATDWAPDQAAEPGWPCASPGLDALAFDFGFDQDPSPLVSEPYVASADPWANPYVHELPLPQKDFTAITPGHPRSSRRGSGSDELAANLGTFALATTPPVAAAGGPGSLSTAVQGGTDIASRRKRPRPAALTSASLRSRSYGALSATSPSFRNGPPSGGQLRQVKSTGHGLNAHYGGIRKTNPAPKSPLTMSTFAEADTLNSLMAQQMATAAASRTPTPGDHGLGGAMHEPSTMGYPELNPRQTSASDMAAPYQQLQSPPATPFQAEFLAQSGMGAPQPMPVAQYATVAEYTPPYSAGPLTNSTCSWSDAPLQSPDLPHFPTGTYMSSLGFNRPDPQLQQWVLLSDTLPDTGTPKKTEFFITEFPGQKEEHASVAHHIHHPRPKNYVFANTAASDYDV